MSAFPNGDTEQIGRTAQDRIKPEISAFANVGLIRRLRPGDTLIAEGETSRFCYKIDSGVVKEYNTLEDGQRQISDFFGSGDIVGFDNSVEQLHGVEAVSDCVIRCAPKDTLYRVAMSSADASRLIVEFLLERLNRADRRLVMITRKTASERVSAFLLRVWKEQGCAPRTFLAMSRQDIADHLALTIETVCRSLTSLRRRGVIAMPSARYFTVCDEERLLQCAGEEKHPLSLET